MAEGGNNDDTEDGVATGPPVHKSHRRGARVKGMLLRWALLKAMGPDRWSFAQLNDTARNTAMEGAISRVLFGKIAASAPRVGDMKLRILDIGCGYGLFSLCAARAAKAAFAELGSGGNYTSYSVLRVEKLVPVAKVFRKIVGHNSMSDVVTVSSEPLVAEDDSDDSDFADKGGGSAGAGAGNSRDAYALLGGAADVIILNVNTPSLLSSQHDGIFARGLVHALKQLHMSPEIIAANTRVIPAQATVYAALVEVFPQTEIVTTAIDRVSGLRELAEVRISPQLRII